MLLTRGMKIRYKVPRLEAISFSCTHSQSRGALGTVTVQAGLDCLAWVDGRAAKRTHRVDVALLGHAGSTVINMDGWIGYRQACIGQCLLTSFYSIRAV